jgi:hypothetical protein
MEHYIEKILCVEILEKILRFRRYLLSQYSSSKTEGKEVVSLFISSLESTQNELFNIIEFLNRKSVLTNTEKATILRRLSNAFITLLKLHDQLQLIYGSWVRPETHTFINEVTSFFPADRKPKKINIVLTNEYNFLEGNLTWLFDDILNNQNISTLLREENPTVFLPKIDYDNPLNWAILAHECGHTDTSGIRKILKRSNLIPSNLIDDYKSILESWIEEIYCDILASRVLGPAYLASFCTYALLISGIDGNEKSYKSHPANIVRITIIQEYLERLNIKVPFSKEFFNCKDLGNYYYEMLEKYNEIGRKYLNSHVSQETLPFDLTEIIDIISEEVDEFVNLKKNLRIEDFQRIQILKERLSKGITIASYQEISNLEKARQNYPEKNVTIPELNDAKIALQETRTNLWEIINAGWVNKIENLVPKTLDLFFTTSPNNNPKEALDIFTYELQKYDNVLLKSIESSEIFKIMEE